MLTETRFVCKSGTKVKKKVTTGAVYEPSSHWRYIQKNIKKKNINSWEDAERNLKLLNTSFLRFEVVASSSLLILILILPPPHPPANDVWRGRCATCTGVHILHYIPKAMGSSSKA